MPLGNNNGQELLVEVPLLWRDRYFLRGPLSEGTVIFEGTVILEGAVNDTLQRDR